MRQAFSKPKWGNVMLKLIGTAIILFGLFSTAKGVRFGLCTLPAVLVFVVGEAMILDYVQPKQYPGDLFAMFMPLVTGVKSLILTIPLLLLAVMVGRGGLWLADHFLGAAAALPLFTPSRLIGVLCILGVFAAGHCISRWEQQAKEEERDRLAGAIPGYIAGTADEAALEESFRNMPFLCRTNYPDAIPRLMAGEDPRRAAHYARILSQHCGRWTEAYSIMLR